MLPEHLRASKRDLQDVAYALGNNRTSAFWAGGGSPPAGSERSVVATETCDVAVRPGGLRADSGVPEKAP